MPVILTTDEEWDVWMRAGAHISKSSGSQIDGSPARALKISPPFDGFFIIDMNESAMRSPIRKTIPAVVGIVRPNGSIYHTAAG
jgi:hypothetical protein